MTLSRIDVRTPTSATSPSASSGPPTAPRLSIARSKPYARPYALAGTTSASRAFRAGTRKPRAAHAPARSAPTCHTLVETPDERGEHRRGGVAAHRRRATSVRVVCERPASEPGGSRQPVRHALDQTKRAGRRAESRREKARQERRRHLMPEVGQEACEPNVADTGRQPPIFYLSLGDLLSHRFHGWQRSWLTVSPSAGIATPARRRLFWTNARRYSASPGRRGRESSSPELLEALESAQARSAFARTLHAPPVEQLRERPSGGLPPRPSERPERGQDSLRLVEVHLRHFSAVTAVPAQGCPAELRRLVVADEEQ